MLIQYLVDRVIERAHFPGTPADARIEAWAVSQNARRKVPVLLAENAVLIPQAGALARATGAARSNSPGQPVNSQKAAGRALISGLVDVALDAWAQVGDGIVNRYGGSGIGRIQPQPGYLDLEYGRDLRLHGFLHLALGLQISLLEITFIRVRHGKKSRERKVSNWDEANCCFSSGQTSSISFSETPHASKNRMARAPVIFNPAPGDPA